MVNYDDTAPDCFVILGVFKSVELGDLYAFKRVQDLSPDKFDPVPPAYYGRRVGKLSKEVVFTRNCEREEW